jgi:hypothetical protein
MVAYPDTSLQLHVAIEAALALTLTMAAGAEAMHKTRYLDIPQNPKPVASYTLKPLRYSVHHHSNPPLNMADAYKIHYIQNPSLKY